MWHNFPNFSEKEFACKHCGECKMDVKFMEKLQELRYRFNRPMSITSGYRCPNHPVEMGKTSKSPGAHTQGLAADIAVYYNHAYDLLDFATDMGFLGIGVKQDGAVTSRFIHLDMMPRSIGRTVFSY